MTIDLLHIVSLAAGPRAGSLASWPQPIGGVPIGTVTLLGATLVALLVWLVLRLRRLHRHMSLLDRAMDVVGSAVFITDAARLGHPVIAVNPAFTRLTGYDSHSVLGRPGRLLEGAETALSVKKLVTVALRDGRSCRSEATLHARDGKAIASDLRLTAVHDRAGRHVYTIWEVREPFRPGIPPLTQEGAACLLQAIARALPHPLVLTSDQGTVQAVSPAAAQLFGYTADELQGQPVATVLPSAEDVHRSLQSGSPAPMSRETIGLRKEGTTIPVSVTGHDLVVGGQPRCVFTCEDLTQVRRDTRRHASWVPLADRLGKSARLTPECAKDLLQIICEHGEWAMGSLWIVDAEANELRCFQTHAAAGAGLDQMVGAPRRATCKPWEGLVGRVWCKGEPEWSADLSHELDWVPRQPPAETGGVIGQPVRIGGEVIAVLEFFGAESPSTDPSLLPTLASYAALFGQAMARSRAEDEIEHLAQRVRKAQRGEALGSLAGGIAHDLNNTLTAILGFTELAFPAIPAASRARRHLKHIMKAGGRARDLIHQILTFSRQTEHALSPIRLQEVLQETLKLIGPSLPATVELRTSIAPDIPSVLGDPAQLRQVLVNLCANAEYAMRGTQGALEIQAAAVSVTPELAASRPALREKRYARLTVRDTGCGMPAKVKKHAFEPFFTTKPEGEGVGLGLAVVRGIILHHGGAIYMESTPKHGTTIDIFLPLAEQEAAEEPLSADALPRGMERVLLVEDEVALAELGRDMLHSLGYEVVVRTNPADALHAFELMPQRFDLLVTDQTMPRMTGETLVREVLRLRPDIPVIMMTGFSHTMDADKARALGVRGFLRKPLLLRDLAPAIRRALGKPGATPVSSRSPGQLGSLIEWTRERHGHERHAVRPDHR